MSKKRRTLNEAWFIYNMTVIHGRKIIKRLNKDLVSQKRSNIRFSKNSSIFSADHFEFLKKILMIPQKPAIILHKIKQKMCSNFKGLHSFSLETLRFTLRNKVGASYRLINKINLKLTKPQNVIWLVRMTKIIQRNAE